MGLQFKLMLILILTCLLPTVIVQNSTQQSDYQASLKTIVKNMQESIDKMVDEQNKGLQTANLFNQSNIISSQIYKTALSHTRSIITSTLSTTTIPFALNKQHCTPISSTDLQNLRTRQQQIQASTQVLTDKVNQLSNISSCPQVQDLKTQNSLLIEQNKILQSEITQFCAEQPSNPSTSNTTNTSSNPLNNQSSSSNNSPPIFVNNLDNQVNNWIYGNINPQQFYSNVNKKIAQGARLCPSQSPYVDPNNNCISCPVIYSVASQKCASCPSGSSLNKNIHQCDSSSGQTIIKNSNPQGNNFIGTPPTTIANLSQCADATPYFDGNQCINCSLPNYFDYSTSVCLMCAQGQEFDLTSKICKPIDNSVNPQFTKYNSNIGSNVNYVGNPNVLSNAEACSDDHPFFNGLNCISCALPLYFNFTSKVCQACENNYIFDSNTKGCKVDPSKIYYSSSLNGVGNYIGAPPTLANPTDKLVQPCPTSTPFSNGKQCLSCPEPKFFNYQTSHCQKCSNQLTFSKESKTCVVRSGTVSKNSNLNNVSNFMYAVPLYNDSLTTCSQNAPYFNGGACISCSLPLFFNFKTFLCQNCPSQQHFNPSNRLCEFTNQKFISDTNNQNIYFNGDYQAFARQVNSKRDSDPSIEVCPSNTPFYSATANTCISCPEDSPIFNIKYNRCISCGDDSSFDTSSRICIYNKGVGLSLERTLMNTFSL